MAWPLYLPHYAPPPLASPPSVSRSFQGLRFTKSSDHITISGPDNNTITYTSRYDYYLATTNGEFNCGGGSSADGIDTHPAAYFEVVLVSGDSDDGDMSAIYVGLVRPGLDHVEDHSEGDNAWYMEMSSGGLWGNGEEDSNKKGGLEVGDRIGVAVQDNTVRWYVNGEEYNRHPKKVTGSVVLGVEMYLEGQEVRLITNPTLPEGL